MLKPMNDKGVIIFSPSKYSLYTLCVLKLCKIKGIPISGIIILNLFNYSRFKSEFKRDGNRLIKKIWKKFFLREGAYKSINRYNIAVLKENLNIEEKSVINYAKKNKIKVLFCNSFNESKIEIFLKELKPEISLFTGGGIIRKKIIDCFKIGIVNCHMGILPDYRGMDVVEWPIIENNFHKMGLTTHLMDSGIDTGKIIQSKNYELDPKNQILECIRNDYEPIMCEMLVEACILLKSNNFELIDQRKIDGKQYFIMHKKLKLIAQTILTT